MLVGAHNGAVDHLDSVLAFTAVVQRLQDNVPDPGNRPAAELAIDRTPLAEMLVQITPGHACAGNPEDAIKDHPVVHRRPAAACSRTHQKRRKERPFLIFH